MVIVHGIAAFLFVPALFCLLCALYLAVLLVAAFAGSRTRRAAVGTASVIRLAVAIPAHNEEKLLARTIESVLECDYPRDAFEIVVVADNSTDHTADVARGYKVTVLEREDALLRGKGYALEFFIRHYLSTHEAVEAVIVIDADSLVSTNLLRTVNVCIASGSVAGQVRDTTDNAGDGWRTAMQFISLALKNHVRALGRQALGCSAGLFGNGMFFSRRLLLERGWPAKSIVEDTEFGLNLALDGIGVCYAPEAEVLALMPTTDAAGQVQKTRWEFGQWQLLRGNLLPLIRAAIWRRSSELLLWCFELLTPPLVTLFAVNGFILLFSLVIVSLMPTWSTLIPVVLSASGVALLGLYAVGGLILSRAPRVVWGSLLMLPVYAFWKARVYARLLVRGGPAAWIRTDRD